MALDDASPCRPTGAASSSPTASEAARDRDGGSSAARSSARASSAAPSSAAPSSAAPSSAPLQLLSKTKGAIAAPASFDAGAYAQAASDELPSANAKGEREQLFSRASWKPPPADLQAKSIDSMLGPPGQIERLDDDDVGLSAAEQAVRAIEVQRSGAGASMPPKPAASFGPLSDSLGAMPPDAFLERLSLAEGMPASPNALLAKAGGAHKALSRVVPAMPTSPMAMAM